MTCKGLTSIVKILGETIDHLEKRIQKLEKRPKKRPHDRTAKAERRGAMEASTSEVSIQLNIAPIFVDFDIEGLDEELAGLDSYAMDPANLDEQEILEAFEDLDGGYHIE